jgi:hypothetical protein
MNAYRKDFMGTKEGLLVKASVFDGQNGVKKIPANHIREARKIGYCSDLRHF